MQDIKMRYKLIPRVLIIFGLILSLLMTVICVFSITQMFSLEFYTRSQKTIIRDIFQNYLYDDYQVLETYAINEDYNLMDHYVEDTNLSYELVYMYDGSLDNNFESYNENYYGSNKNIVDVFEEYHVKGDYDDHYFMENGQFIDVNGDNYILYVYLNLNLNNHDVYSVIYNVVSTFYSLRYAIYIILIIFVGIDLILATYCFSILGHNEEGELVIHGMTKLPLELYLFVVGIFYCIAILISNYFFNGIFNLIITIILIFSVIYDLLIRYKINSFFTNTILFKLFYYFKLIPVLPRLSLIWIAFSLFIIYILNLPFKSRLLIWLIANLFIFPFILAIGSIIKTLTEATKAYVDGNFDFKINEKLLFGIFKDAAHNLNSLKTSMNDIIDEKMRSERMKTELITNVSHDIKTPLTSIINYADLIGKENTDNPKIQEYSQVLLKQSTRLKVLIQNLIETSKISSGNIEVNLNLININVMIEQLVGEYKERLNNKKIEVIVNYCANNIDIMLDSKLFVRAFDNLMINILKYSLPNSRAYISIIEETDYIYIVLKNTSKVALNISSEELMQRFVRGDSSRNSSGNGLGLSIAKGLIEAQKGEFNLIIDGDLFKVIMKFDK